MLKTNVFVYYLLVFFLIIFYYDEDTRYGAQAKPDTFSLRKFSINFREIVKSNLKKKNLRNQKEAEQKRKEEEEEEQKRRRVEEEKIKMEKIEAFRRRVFQEYLLNQVTGKTTVLKDFFSRF